MKPREFWISPEDWGTDAYMSESPYPGMIHLIEKSAYDQLKAENEIALMERDLAERQVSQCNTRIELLMTEIDQLNHDNMGFDSEADYIKQIDQLKLEVEKHESVLQMHRQKIESMYSSDEHLVYQDLEQENKILRAKYAKLERVLKELVDQYTPDYNGKTKLFDVLIKEARALLDESRGLSEDHK